MLEVSSLLVLLLLLGGFFVTHNVIQWVVLFNYGTLPMNRAHAIWLYHTRENLLSSSNCKIYIMLEEETVLVTTPTLL